MIVPDASVVALALAGEEETGRRARDLIRDGEPYAPELVDLEVVAYLRRAVRQRRMGSQRALQALVDLAWLPIRRVPHTPLLSRIWDLRDNVSAYDASYVALAETMQARLLTADRRLARAPGIRCEVVVLT